MYAARLYERLPSILSQHPGSRWVFLTLTVSNCNLGELRGQLQAMNAAYRRMTRWKAWPALGWIRSTEVTRGQDSKAHPHYHCLLLVPGSYFGRGYIPQADWVRWWRKAMQIDYDPVVDVRAVKPKVTGGELKADATVAAVREAVKYVAKPEAMADSEWLVGFTLQVRNLRLIDSGGVLRGVLAEDETEDLVHVDDQAKGESEDELASELPFRWHKKRQHYRRSRR